MAKSEFIQHGRAKCVRVADGDLPGIADFIAGAEACGRQSREKVRAICLQALIVISATERIVRAKPLIDLNFPIVDSFFIGALREEVVVSLVRIENIPGRRRIQVEQLL